MHDMGMFERRGQLTGEGFEGSGADWLELYKPYIDGGTNIIVTAPHKLYGPENNDLILQLRKRGVNKVVVCGMSGNLCAESHLRELQERGFEAAVIFDGSVHQLHPVGGEGLHHRRVRGRDAGAVSTGLYRPLIGGGSLSGVPERIIIPKTAFQ